MNDSVLKRVLEKSLMLELAEFEDDKVSEHKFSLKHCLAMKRIFARYERNVRKLRKKETVRPSSTSEYKPQISLKQRLLLVTIVIILMTFLVGWVVVFVSERFHGTVYHDNTLLTAVDLENCPKTIEYKYVLVSVPENFEILESVSSPVVESTRYINKVTNQEITLWQCAKASFQPHYNTEHYSFEEISINEKSVLIIDFSDKNRSNSLVLWDNGDYIIEILADFDKSALLELVDINKNVFF